ncbi:histidine--tRNA ligase, cytoplasmic-like [Euphorbia lathyris]|uniref:histidine--tRNA ligase, cytoplasmic-like n=1 Tax=Euphorbia lathyris TaxID=212925 RepID=UPI0033141A3C
MAGKGELKVVSLGGKGFSLSSSSAYAVATGQAQLRIDSSALDRLISDQNPPKSLKPSQILFPSTFTSLEIRASLTFLLNKLLLFSNSTNIRAFLPNIISICLNSKPETSSLDSIDVTEEENLVIQKSSALVYGICAILDHESTNLVSVVAAVAAISCEAAKGNVAAFSSMDTGDGFVDKEGLRVAGDMKVFLNGSKLVGKLESEAFSKIPKINGRLREAVKSLHSMTRIALNSREEVHEGDVVPAVLALAAAILKFGKNSFCRAKMNLDALGIESLKTSLLGMFENKCPNDEALKNAYKLLLDSHYEDDIAKFVHEVSALLGIVWRIVAWEAITAYVALEGGELISTTAVLGKGTSVVVQLIKDRLQNKGGVSNDVLEQLVGDLLLFFDPKQPEFDEMVHKVKEIVESNESRRFPKLSKATSDFAKEQMMIRERAFSIITELIKRHGATRELDTPAFELRETLMRKYGSNLKLISDLAHQVKLNHRSLLDGMLEICGVPPEKFGMICSSIDKLDKQSLEQVKKEMVEEKGLSVETADNIGRVVFELSLAYYTGVIFETVFNETTQDVSGIGDISKSSESSLKTKNKRTYGSAFPQLISPRKKSVCSPGSEMPEILNGRKIVRVPDAVIAEGIKQCELCLVGQLLGKSSVELNLVLDGANKLWGKEGRIEVSKMKDKVYIFKFPNEKIRDFVVESGPWYIEEKRLMLRKWQPKMKLWELDNSKVPVWVKLRGIPMEYRTIKGLSYIASALGKPLYGASAGDDTCLLNYVKVCVEVSMDDDIMDYITVMDDDGDEWRVKVEYVGMPEKCLSCKEFGQHSCFSNVQTS